MNPQIMSNIEQRFGTASNIENQNSASIVYLPTATSQSNSTLKGVVGITLGFIFAAMGLLFTIVLLFLVPPAALVGLLILIIGLAMAAGFGWKLFVRKSEKLQLTTNSLSYKSRTQTIELPLTQINHIYAIQRTVWRETMIHVRRMYQVSYWCVRIETTTSNFIELEVTQLNWLGTFDVGKLLQDLLSRLPISTQIDPRIHSYLQTGAIN